MIISVAITILALGQTPQAQYDEYVKQFEGKTVCGTLLQSGAGQPEGTAFRAAPGGKYHAFSATYEFHCDGKVEFTYMPEDHTYSEHPPATSTFQILLGPKFAPLGAAPYEVSGAIATTFDEEEARVFTITSKTRGRYDLIVRVKDLRPLAIRQFADQGAFTSRVVELRTDWKLSDAGWTWSPPAGAKKR